MLAGMCYGGLGGLIFVTASAFIISSVIFFMVRKLGKKFVYDFCDEEKVKKIENSKSLLSILPRKKPGSKINGL